MGSAPNIASGGDLDFMRPFAEQLYGIPPERVIGSAFGLDLRLGEEDTRLLYKSEIDFFKDGPEKPVRIWSRIGRRPRWRARTRTVMSRCCASLASPAAQHSGS